MASTFLLQVPPEVIEQALLFAQPVDVASFAQACRATYEIVYSTSRGSYLWQRLCLALYDDPREATHRIRPDDESPDWKSIVQRRAHAERWMLTKEPEKLTDWTPVLSSLLEALEQVPMSADQASRNISWMTNILQGPPESLIPWVHEPSEAEKSLLARLKSYLTLAWGGLARETIIQLTLTRGDDSQSSPRVKKLKAIRRASRAIVYNLEGYTKENTYGPFFNKEQGQTFPNVNWPHFEACVNTVTLNALTIDQDDHASNSGTNGLIKPPMGLEATRPYSAPRCDRARPDDWAGVEGRWRRLVCFMDYRDLFAYNYTNYAGGPLNPSFFDQISFREATRLIAMDLHVTSVGNVKSPSSGDETPLETSLAATQIEDFDLQSSTLDTETPERRLLAEKYPDIHFTGRAISSHGYDAILTGVVRMAEDGTVRWSWLYRMLQMDLGVCWSSVGVQIGHESSAAGIVGTWTGANHDEDDPAGPFWMWKVPDDAPTQTFYQA